MFPIINIGPLALQAGGFIFLICFFIGTWMTSRLSLSIGTHTDAIENISLYSLGLGLLAARLGFLLKNISVFLNHPLSLLSLTPSMLDLGFGILIGILTAIILAQRKHLPLWPTLDTFSPFLLLSFIALQLANMANGNAFGLPTNLPWGVLLWNETRHPVQIYALFLSGAVLIWFLLHTKLLKTTGFAHSGVLFNVTTGCLALINLFIQAFVAEKILFGPVDLIQLISLGVFIICIYLIDMHAFPKDSKVNAFISMGSNIEPQLKLDQAVGLISREFQIHNLSSRYKTQDINQDPKTPDFINQIIEIETDLSVNRLLTTLKSIEGKAGRQHLDEHLVALDLDLLTYGREVCQIGGKSIPPADLIKYHYLARPLAEISPSFRHPANGRSITEIIETISGELRIIKINEG